MGVYSEDTTYLACYGMNPNGFANRTEVISKTWAYKIDKSGKIGSNYVSLSGKWAKGSTAMAQNYFILSSIDGKKITDNFEEELSSICDKNLKNKLGKELNFSRYFASNSSFGYEYPILSSKEASKIVSSINPSDVFDVKEILRFAYVAEYAYYVKDEQTPKFYPGMTRPDQSDCKKEREDASQFGLANHEIKKNNSDCGETQDPTAELNQLNLEEFQEIFGPEGKYKLVAQKVYPESKLHAVAIKVPSNSDKSKENVIIGYKGTSIPIDVLHDARLMIVNFFESSGLVKLTKDALDFYKNVLKDVTDENKGNPVVCQGSIEEPFWGVFTKTVPANCENLVITGHSLGGYIGLDVAARTGNMARVFSAPATYVAKNIHSMFASQMRLNNAINFVRKGDPVAVMSGRHLENMVYFPSPSYNPVDGHFLGKFINQILYPLAFPNRPKKDPTYNISPNPTHIYVTPDTDLGSGLKSRINCWGSISECST